MKLCWRIAAAAAVGLVLACSQGADSTPAPPDLDLLRAGLQERDDLERKYLLASYLRTLGPENLGPTLEEIEKHRAGIEPEEVRLLMFAWGRFDAPGAFEAARNWPTSWRSVLMEEAMYAWGFHDGRAALERSQKIESEDLRQTLRSAAVSGWVASNDSAGATEYAATVLDGRQRNRLALRLAGQAKRDGPDAIIAWAEAVPVDAPNDFKETAFFHASGMVARLDPEHAARWYEREMVHEYTKQGLPGIASKWAFFQDPNTLLAWIETLPIDPAREGERTEAIRTAYRIWAPEDAEEAEAWLEKMSPGPGRDTAISEFARATIEVAPANALHWVREIEDEDLRRKRVFRYVRAWFKQDPDAAATWLAETDLPEDVRAEAPKNVPQAVRWHDAKRAEPEG